VHEASTPPLAERVARVDWYHTLELPGGILTPGSFETGEQLARVPFPRSLAGKRCLDVATADGFWAFEMERRGAEEVIAIDIRHERLDWPGDAAAKARAGDGLARSRSGFELAHEVLGSRVHWQEHSVYELDPAVLGEFDFVFAGSVLIHLRDPVAALAAILRVLRGELLSFDAISAPLTFAHPRRPVAQFNGREWPLWWVPNLQAYRDLFPAAGLDVLAAGSPFFVKRGRGYSGAYDLEDQRLPLLRRARHAATARLGNMHAWVRAQSA
jgi:tRNA (mo5U34)-methyltransferase